MLQLGKALSYVLSTVVNPARYPPCLVPTVPQTPVTFSTAVVRHQRDNTASSRRSIPIKKPEPD